MKKLSFLNNKYFKHDYQKKKDQNNKNIKILNKNPQYF